MKKSLKIALLLVIFFLMISSLAFASFNNIISAPITESATLMLQGIGMIGLGSFLREAVRR